jgi:hypothetical protein
MKMGKQRSILQRMIRQCGTVQTMKLHICYQNKTAGPVQRIVLVLHWGVLALLFLEHKHTSDSRFSSRVTRGSLENNGWAFVPAVIIDLPRWKSSWPPLVLTTHIHVFLIIYIHPSKNQLRAPPPRNVTRHTLAWPFLSGWSIGYGFELDQGKRMVGERGD